MNHHDFLHSHLQQGAGGVAQADRVEFAFRISDFETGCFTRFDFVKDTIIDVLQSGADDLVETIAVLTHHINACL